ncbi:hypothetical protein [Saccharothrix sp. NRRL B-16314]|uniref:hypothetical protein n=1 Tax=Saccharothrix sp. NRRL B-16314 TaxID=1463825 RepID=UPI0018CC3802|nr:hypothetical protein [Saccharothrix sp. NRRL B-16314]
MASAMSYADGRLSALPAISFHSSCDVAVGDGTPRTDVAWFDAWRDGVYGEAFCKYQWPNDGSGNVGECDQNHVYLVGEVIRRDAPNDEHGYSSVACHELGHTLGFKGIRTRHPTTNWTAWQAGILARLGPPMSRTATTTRRTSTSTTTEEEQCVQCLHER